MKTFKLVSRCAIAVVVTAIGASARSDELVVYQAKADADGVQRIALIGGSYFFRPNHVVVQAGQPLEISVKIEPGIVPHSFVLESADGKSMADVSLSEEPKILRLNLPAGSYEFYCPKQLLGFKSHRERGMAGTLEARE